VLGAPVVRVVLLLPGDMKGVCIDVREVDEVDSAMALFLLVEPRSFPVQPGQPLAVALDAGGQRVEGLDDGARLIGPEPRIEDQQLLLQQPAEQARGLIPAPEQGLEGVSGSQPISAA